MTLFEKLKAETKTEHEELEKALDLLSPDFSIDDYRELLKKFYGVYFVVEDCLKKSKLADHYHGRFKTQHIRQDLLNLGMSEQEIQTIPICGLVIPLDNLNFLIGTLYVLEGSTLGALILMKHFHSRFDLNSLNGLLFFSGYGEETLVKWKEWRLFSEKYASEHDLSHPAIITQAQNTFTFLRSWLTQ
ncbi:MAG: biliverdin-producing heme oxygenase [Bdellovibrionota bacterium]